MAIEPEIELAIGGTFSNVTPDVYFADAVDRNAGASAEGTEVEATEVGLRLKSPNGKYANRNPQSPYYGRIGRNTPLRMSVAGGTASLVLPQDAGSAKAAAPDSAALSITGDIDVRVDLTPDAWTGNFVIPPDTTSGFQEIVGKFTHTGNQRSWALAIRSNGTIAWSWSTTGANTLTLSSTERIPFGPRRRGAIRVTMDVNNGGGGHTLNFYTSDSIDGVWERLGNTVGGSGVTSIFDSTAPVDIGNITGIGSASSLRRIINAVEIRDGINGTTVAKPVFLGATPGAPSVTDPQGNTWTFSGGAGILTRRNRFVVEGSEWQPEWDTSGEDASTPVTGGGLLRRLQMGESPLQSTLRRRVGAAPNLRAYWPMEDGENTVNAASAIPFGRALWTSGMTFQADGTLGGSRALPEAEGLGRMQAFVPTAGHSLFDPWTVNMVYRYTGTRPTSPTEFLEWYSSGTMSRWRILMQNGLVTIRAYDRSGDIAIDQGAAIGNDVWDDFVRFRFTCDQSGGTVTWRLTFINIGQGGGSISNTFSGSAGSVSEINTNFGTQISNGRLIVGHLSVLDGGIADTDPYNYADHGYTAERAADRAVRLAAEEGVPLRLVGSAYTSPPMGPQHVGTFTEVLQSCTDVDGGVLYEDPERLGLIFRTRETMQRQTPILTMPYDRLVQPLRPSDDDQLSRNEITRTRTDGGSFVAEQFTGPMSTQLPPNGIGRYTDSQELNVHHDSQLQHQAGWALRKGTWDEARYKKITILLHKPENADLIEPLLQMQIGDLIRIIDMPDFLPPGPVDLIVEGFREVITGLTWSIELNCSPGGIWDVGVVDGGSAGTGDIGNRADTSGSSLVLAVTDTASDFLVRATQGPQWIRTATHPAQFPFRVKLGGEEVTVQRITGRVEDSFGRTASSGWGTPDVGAAWSNDGGTATDYSVSGGLGGHLLASVNVSRRTFAGGNFSDTDLMVDISASAVATGATLHGGLMSRYTDTNNLYMARVNFQTGGAVNLEIRKRVAATETQLASISSVGTYSGGTTYRLRMRTFGTLIMAKIWLASQVEPTSWTLRVNDSDLTLGSQGMRSIAATGNTNVSPSIRYDNYVILNPQGFNVERAVNGAETVDEVSDHFGDRALTNGWGSAQTGQAWSFDGATAADYSVTSGTARHSVSSAGVLRATRIPVNEADQDVYMRWSLSALPLTDSAYAFACARYTSVTSMYLARVQIAPGGAMTLTLRKRNGAETQLGASYATGFTYAPAAFYTIRLQVTGSVVRAKVWLSSTAEPDAWAITVTDTDLTAAGSAACRTLLGGSATNTLPLTFQFEDFYVATTPRTVDGVVKAHAASTPLSLARPMVAALK